MSLRLSLLGLLYNHSMTGYDLKKMADMTIARFREAQTSQVYRELNYMEDLGWLTSVIEIQTDKPNKRIYSITASGKQAFMDWLLEKPLDEEKLNVTVFVMKTFFATHRSDQENLEIFKQFKRSCAERLKETAHSHEKLNEHVDRMPAHKEQAFYWDLAFDFEQDYYNMCIKWANRCIGLMNSKKAE